MPKVLQRRERRFLSGLSIELIGQFVRRYLLRCLVFRRGVDANDEHDHDRDRNEKGECKTAFAVRYVGRKTRHDKSLATGSEWKTRISTD